jgi:hypothetical protein
VPDERFDALGCWMGLFGVSAVGCTLLVWAAVSVWEASRGRRAPGLQWRVMAVPGAGAGIFWSIANLFGTLAVLRGGNAVVIAQINAFSLIVSGLWGLLWYREIRGRPAAYWVVAACFTLAMTMLLGLEKGK